MGQDELMTRFDKNQDGQVSKDDLPMMNEVERLTLAATPLCSKLGLTCISK